MRSSLLANEFYFVTSAIFMAALSNNSSCFIFCVLYASDLTFLVLSSTFFIEKLLVDDFIYAIFFSLNFILFLSMTGTNSLILLSKQSLTLEQSKFFIWLYSTKALLRRFTFLFLVIYSLSLCVASNSYLSCSTKHEVTCCR